MQDARAANFLEASSYPTTLAKDIERLSALQTRGRSSSRSDRMAAYTFRVSVRIDSSQSAMAQYTSRLRRKRVGG